MISSRLSSSHVSWKVTFIAGACLTREEFGPSSGICRAGFQDAIPSGPGSNLHPCVPKRKSVALLAACLLCHRGFLVSSRSLNGLPSWSCRRHAVVGRLREALSPRPSLPWTCSAAHFYAQHCVAVSLSQSCWGKQDTVLLASYLQLSLRFH